MAVNLSPPEIILFQRELDVCAPAGRSVSIAVIRKVGIGTCALAPAAGAG